MIFVVLFTRIRHSPKFHIKYPIVKKNPENCKENIKFEFIFKFNPKFSDVSLVFPM